MISISLFIHFILYFFLSSLINPVESAPLRIHRRVHSHSLNKNQCIDACNTVFSEYNKCGRDLQIICNSPDPNLNSLVKTCLRCKWILKNDLCEADLKIINKLQTCFPSQSLPLSEVDPCSTKSYLSLSPTSTTTKYYLNTSTIYSIAPTSEFPISTNSIPSTTPLFVSTTNLESLSIATTTDSITTTSLPYLSLSTTPIISTTNTIDTTTSIFSIESTSIANSDSSTPIIISTVTATPSTSTCEEPISSVTSSNDFLETNVTTDFESIPYSDTTTHPPSTIFITTSCDEQGSLQSSSLSNPIPIETTSSEVSKTITDNDDGISTVVVTCTACKDKQLSEVSVINSVPSSSSFILESVKIVTTDSDIATTITTINAASETSVVTSSSSVFQTVTSSQPIPSEQHKEQSNSQVGYSSSSLVSFPSVISPTYSAIPTSLGPIISAAASTLTCLECLGIDSTCQASTISISGINPTNSETLVLSTSTSSTLKSASPSITITTTTTATSSVAYNDNNSESFSISNHHHDDQPIISNSDERSTIVQIIRSTRTVTIHPPKSATVKFASSSSSAIEPLSSTSESIPTSTTIIALSSSSSSSFVDQDYTAIYTPPVALGAASHQWELSIPVSFFAFLAYWVV